MKDSCIKLGSICSKEGILHDHVLSMRLVPKVIQAAKMLPRNQQVLQIAVTATLSLG